MALVEPFLPPCRCGLLPPHRNALLNGRYSRRFLPASAGPSGATKMAPPKLVAVALLLWLPALATFAPASALHATNFRRSLRAGEGAGLVNP